MKAALVCIVVFLLPATLFAAADQTAFLPDDTEYFADRFLVTTSVGTPSLALEQTMSGYAVTGVNSIDNLCAENRVVSIEPFYSGPVKSVGLRDLIPRMYIFHVAPSTDCVAASDAFRSSPDVEISEIYSIPQATYLPNDPQRGLQWHLTRTQGYEAWDILRGDTTRYAIVGIVDTGVYWMHPDLAPNMWINTPEDLNGNGTMDDDDLNGIDDDGNGYVDDVIGWDLGVNDNDPQEETPTHGTHVAGCASEATDNSLNGAGLGFSARLMAVKGANRNGDLTAVYQGMIWASENGVHIINCSWGSYYRSDSYQNIITGIWNNGVVVVAAAGNFNNSQYFYPAAYDHVLSVAATNSGDRKASFSTYGSWVDVSAPGENIYATWDQSGFTSLSGTSMASPVTCGVAALLRAAHPDWTNTEIVETIINTADNIDDLNPNYVGQLGSGRVNAYAALGSASQPNIEVASQQVHVNNDDGDNMLNPGESFALVVTLHNIWADAHNVSATVNGAGFVFADSSASFGNIAHNGSADNSADPFLATANEDMIPGSKEINVHVTADPDFSWDLTVSLDVLLNQLGFPITVSGNVESSPVIADFDNDGDNELVFGSSGSSVNAVEANGVNCVGWPQVVTSEVLSGPAIGDLDHDGDNEVVAISKDGKIYAWHSNGTPLAGFPVNKGGSFFSGPVLADIDGDLDLEIIAGSFADNKVYVINNDGSDHVGWPTQAICRWYGSAAVGDIDGDLLNEIIYAGHDSSVHAWNGDGSAVAGFPVHLDGAVWTAAAIGDVDENSSLEIAVVTYAGSCYLINNDGSIVNGFPVTTSHACKSAPAMADLDGNGTLEILFGDSDGFMHALNSQGAEMPGFPKTLGGIIFASPVIGDITGDGLADIIAGSTDGTLYGIDRNGNDLRNFPIPGSSSRQITVSAALGDLDHDGRMEIAVGIKAADMNMVVLDYKEQAAGVNLQWPNQGRDIFRSSNFSLMATSVDEPVNVPVSFGLAQNYPNPFNATTTIEFTLGRRGEATLSIFDILGRQVKVLHSGQVAPGKHVFNWDGASESGNVVNSGVYFYRLVSSEGSMTRRMTLLK